jgi:hypothetical protein
MWETRNGMQEHIQPNPETTGTPLDQEEKVHTNKNYEIKTSNDNGMRRHGSHIPASKPPTSTRKSKPNELFTCRYPHLYPSHPPRRRNGRGQA